MLRTDRVYLLFSPYVYIADTDSVPQIAMIVSVSAVSFIIIVFFITIG